MLFSRRLPLAGKPNLGLQTSLPRGSPHAPKKCARKNRSPLVLYAYLVCVLLMHTGSGEQPHTAKGSGSITAPTPPSTSPPWPLPWESLYHCSIVRTSKGRTGMLHRVWPGPWVAYSCGGGCLWSSQACGESTCAAVRRLGLGICYMVYYAIVGSIRNPEGACVCCCYLLSKKSFYQTSPHSNCELAALCWWCSAHIQSTSAACIQQVVVPPAQF